MADPSTSSGRATPFERARMALQEAATRNLGYLPLTEEEFAQGLAAALRELQTVNKHDLIPHAGAATLAQYLEVVLEDAPE